MSIGILITSGIVCIAGTRLLLRNDNLLAIRVSLALRASLVMIPCIAFSINSIISPVSLFDNNPKVTVDNDSANHISYDTLINNFLDNNSYWVHLETLR